MKGSNIKAMENMKDFNRGECFTFFSSFYKQGKEIEKALGKEKALDYYNAIIEYALTQKQITDPELLLLIGYPTLETIDQSQNRRAKMFHGEDMKLTEVILKTQRDHPELSQNALAKKVGCSKGKVNRVLTKFKNGEYAGEFDFNVVINGISYTPSGVSGHYTYTNTYTNTDTNTNSDRDRNDRDRCAVTDHHEAHGSLSVGVACAPDVADAPKRCATLAHPKSEWKFDGVFSDKDMLGIIRRECEKIYPDYQSGSSDFSDIHELRGYLLEKYSDTQGYYRCKNIDELESCINALLCNAQ